MPHRQDRERNARRDQKAAAGLSVPSEYGTYQAPERDERFEKKWDIIVDDAATTRIVFHTWRARGGGRITDFALHVEVLEYSHWSSVAQAHISKGRCHVHPLVDDLPDHEFLMRVDTVEDVAVALRLASGRMREIATTIRDGGRRAADE